MRNLNVIGPEVRRLRSRRNWSQNDLAIKLQLLGADVTRVKVSKIEARLVWVSDDDLIFLSRALGVGVEDLYPDYIRCAKQLCNAIDMSKASRFGAFIVGFITCSGLGAAAFHFALTVPIV